MTVKFLCRHKYGLITAIWLVFSFAAYSQDNSRFLGKEENLGNNINSPFDELNPTFSPNGDILYFTRSRHPENMGGRDDAGDIWLSKKNEVGEWSKAENAGPVLNNTYYNAVVGFSPNGEKMLLQHHYFDRGVRPQTQGISYVTKKGEGWSTPKPVDIDNFYNSSSHQSACLSSDGKTMVLAINSFGSYGYEDLFVSFRTENGSWTAPKNMGSTLNTPLQEMTPFLSEDNTTLYFASSGHNSMGSRDIFMSRRLDHSWRVWSDPVNLSEINSEGVELSYAISPSEEYAYFISTKNSDGYGDINRIKLNPKFQPTEVIAEENPDFAEPDTVILITQGTVLNNTTSSSDLQTAGKNEKQVLINGLILDIKNNEPIQARVRLSPIGSTQSSQEVVPEVINGKFSVGLEEGSRYKVKISAEGYMTRDTMLDLSEISSAFFQEEYLLTPLEAGATFQLNDVLFERGTATLVDTAYQELDRVSEMLKENPDIHIEIGGHTDNQGDARLNLKLSQERVETVLDYLIQKGVSEDRLVGKGYGGTRPIASNKSEITRKLNRRVEFTILKVE